MQIKRFFVVVSVVAASGWMVAGCSESTSRRTAKNLNEATRKATQLSRRAQSLLSNPQFVADGVRSPLKQPMVPVANVKRLQDMFREHRPQADIMREMDELAKAVAGKVKFEFVPLDQLHPEAITALQEAFKTLDAAISEAGDPRDDAGVKNALAIARAQLASICFDLGQLHRREFGNARAEAAVHAVWVELVARQAAREQALITAMDALLKPALDPSVVSYEQALQEARKMQAAAQVDVDELAAQVRMLNEELAALQGEINQLSQDATEKQLTGQAERFDFDMSEALLEESIAFSERMIDKNREMNEKDAELSEAQTLLAVARATLAVFTGEENAVANIPASAGRVKDADAVVTSYKAMQTRVEAFRKDAQTRLAQYEQQCASGLKDISDCYKRAKAADENALKQFEQAAKAASLSYQLRGDAAAKALEGAALRECAVVRQQQRELLASVLQAVALVPKAGSKDVIGEMDIAGSIKDWGIAAATKFEEAANAFDVAARAMVGERRQQAWVYQANRAASLLQLALMTDDVAKRTAVLNEASKLVGDALTNRENLPELRHVQRLNAQVQLALGIAPKPAMPVIDNHEVPAPDAD